jgi:hypothetical protein
MSSRKLNARRFSATLRLWAGGVVSIEGCELLAAFCTARPFAECPLWNLFSDPQEACQMTL